ncbi:hypothetical protein JCM5350_002341 [Sporobolomyces pararoseus]
MSNLSHGIKHWHWRTKGVEPWAKQWFIDNLVGTSANGVEIAEVSDVEGDCELGMRKSKLITVYDQKVTMKWKATNTEGEEVAGTLIALEVAHDMDEDEYKFEASITSGSGKEADAFYLTAKRALADKLRPKFQQFPKDMVATHGKDLLDAAAEANSSAENSGANTPATSSSSAPTPSAPKTASSTSSSKPTSTAVVRATGEFQADAATLWDFLTNSDKLPMWTRNPAKMAPQVDAEMELFGGNIRGKVQQVEAPKKLVTSWRAPTWPDNHYGTLETTLDQGSNSTTLNLKLSGVPIGKEDETEQNLQTFYIRGLQAIGLGLFSSTTSSATSSSTHISPVSPPPPLSVSSKEKRPNPRRTTPQSSRFNRWTLANVGTFVASFGLILGMGAAFYYGPSGPGSKK